jgi:chaperonin GroEL
MPTTRAIISGKECREALQKGVQQLASAVGSTLGPSGRAVTIAQRQQNGYYWPHTTKDGARVATAIVLEDALLSVGANMIKQASAETAAAAGDGSTSAAVIAEALVVEGFKLIEAGANPHEIKAQMEEACEKVVEYLKKMAIPVTGDMIRHVAIVSANGDEELGNIVADAYNSINENGVVTLEKATGPKTRVESVKGMLVPSGTLEFYINDFRNKRSEFKNPVIAITTELISHYKDLEGVVKYCTEQKRPLLLFADNVIGEAQAFLLGNLSKFPSCVVSIPESMKSAGDILKDLSVVTGAHVLGKSHGTVLSKSNFHHYGSAEKTEVYTNRSVIVGGGGKPEVIEQRTDFIKKQIEEAGSNEDERDELQKRLSAIDGGISVIYVGVETEAQFSELFDRYDDAVKAVRGAKTGGILPGGGMALIQSKYGTERNEDHEGYILLLESLSSPLVKISENTFADRKKGNDFVLEILSQVFHEQPHTYGYNFRTSQYGDMIEMGIIDPAIVTITALQKAVSVAGSILITDHIIINS